MAWVNIVLFFLYYNLYNGLCCGHYVTFMQWNLLFALKLFLHSPNRYYTSLEFHIGNTKSKSWVETYLIPSNATKKKKRKESKNATHSKCKKGFGMKEEPKNMVILRIFLILNVFFFFFKLKNTKVPTRYSYKYKLS